MPSNKTRRSFDSLARYFCCHPRLTTAASPRAPRRPPRRPPPKWPSLQCAHSSNSEAHAAIEILPSQTGELPLQLTNNGKADDRRGRFGDGLTRRDTLLLESCDAGEKMLAVEYWRDASECTVKAASSIWRRSADVASSTSSSASDSDCDSLDAPSGYPRVCSQASALPIAATR